MADFRKAQEEFARKGKKQSHEDVFDTGFVSLEGETQHDYVLCGDAPYYSKVYIPIPNEGGPPTFRVVHRFDPSRRSDNGEFVPRSYAVEGPGNDKSQLSMLLYCTLTHLHERKYVVIDGILQSAEPEGLHLMTESGAAYCLWGHWVCSQHAYCFPTKGRHIVCAVHFTHALRQLRCYERRKGLSQLAQRFLELTGIACQGRDEGHTMPDNLDEGRLLEMLGRELPG